MKYKRIAGAAFAIVFAALAITLPMGAWAEEASDAGGSEAVAEESVTEVSTYAELYEASRKGGNIKLMADIEATNYVYAAATATVDLNGHTVSFVSPYFWYVYAYGAADTVVTFTGNGTVKQANPESNIAPIRTYNAYGTEGAKTVAILNDVTIDATNYAVAVTAGGEVVVNDGAKIVSGGYGIAAYKDTTVTVNGGEIDAAFFAISGNGTDESANSKFYVKGGKVTSSGDYAIYVPQIDGVLEISGGEITGARGAVAANRGKITVSGDAKLVSEGTFEASGDVAKDGTRGYVNAVIGMAHEYDDVTLNVSGGTFVAKGDAIMFGDPANGYNTTHTYSVEVSGGRFESTSSKVVEGYGDELVKVVTDGKDVYDLGQDGPWIVDNATTVSLPEGTVYVKLGDTMDLGGYLTDVAKKYGTFGVAEDAAMTIDGETLVATAAKAGTATISFKLHNYKNKVDKTFDVVVYTTGSEDQANEEGSAVEGENEESLAEVSANVMDTVLEDLSKFDNASVQAPVSLMLEDGTKIAVTANTAAIKTALQNGEKVLARLQVSEFVDDHLTGAENALIEGAMSSNAKKFGTVEYRILLETATTMIGEITELPESDTMLITFDVTAEPELAENYRRAYQVIRLHENEAPAVLAATYDSKNHTVSFASNKFSTFTLAYVDTQIVTPTDDTDNTNETTNADTPETGTFTGGEASVSEANVVAIVVALIAIVAVVASAVKFAKSRE